MNRETYLQMHLMKFGKGKTEGFIHICQVKMEAVYIENVLQGGISKTW